MSVETDVAGHSNEGALEQQILAALRQAGKDPHRLGSDEPAQRWGAPLIDDKDGSDTGQRAVLCPG